MNYIDLFLLSKENRQDEVIGGRVRYKRNGKIYWRALPGKGKKETTKGKVRRTGVEGTVPQQVAPQLHGQPMTATPAAAPTAPTSEGQAIEKQPDKYENMTIRELQQEAQRKGVYRSHGLNKQQLQESLRQLDKDPKTQEVVRRTLTRRYQGKKEVLKVLPRDTRKTFRTIDRVRKLIVGEKTLAGAVAIVGAGMVGIGVDEWKKRTDKYRQGFVDSAADAFKRSQNTRVDTVAKENVLFTVGGVQQAGSTAQKIEEELFKGEDTPEDKWFKENNHVVHVAAPSDAKSKPLLFNQGHPLHAAEVATLGFVGHLRNVVGRGRNEASVDLASQIYAYANRYPDKPINILAHQSGGNTAYEAIEILNKMKKGDSRFGGKQILERVNLVNLGTPHFGLTERPDSPLKSGKGAVNHHTIATRHDPYSKLLPKKGAKWIDSVQGGAVESYLGDPNAREFIRDTFGYQMSAEVNKGSVSRGSDPARSQQAESWSKTSPAAVKDIYNRVQSKIQRINNARNNKETATAIAGSSILGVSEGDYQLAIERRRKAIDNAVAEARRQSKNLNPDRNRGNKNVVVTLGGVWQSNEELQEHLPDDIMGKPQYDEEGRFVGYTKPRPKGESIPVLINGHDRYGVRTYPKQDRFGIEPAQDGTEMAYGLELTKGFGRSLRQELGLNGTGEIDLREATQLAAGLHAQIRSQDLDKEGKKYPKALKNYQVNLIASGSSGLTARSALQILKRMNPEYAKAVQLTTIGTPDFGLHPDFEEQELSIYANQDWFSPFPKRSVSHIEAEGDRSIPRLLETRGVRQKLIERLKRRTR